MLDCILVKAMNVIYITAHLFFSRESQAVLWSLSLLCELLLYPDRTLYPTVNMSSDAQEDVVALHPKQPPEQTTYPTYPTYTPGYQLTGGLAAPTVSSANNTEGKKEEEKAEEEYEPGSIPVEHLNVRSVCGQGTRSNKLQ